MLKQNYIIKKMAKKNNVIATTGYEFIHSAVVSLSAMQQLDLELINANDNEEGERIKRIMKRSIRIIDICIAQMHNELFPLEP